jgi:glutamyl-tRNA synthetase
MNGVYMRELPPERFADLLKERLESDLPPKVPRPLDKGFVMRLAPLAQERMKRLDEAIGLLGFFFIEGPLEYDVDTLLGKRFADKREEAARVLETVIDRVSGVERWQHEALEAVLRPLAEETGLKTGDLFMLVRVAVTGRTATPPLFETMEVLGRERSLSRLREALQRLRAQAR